MKSTGEVMGIDEDFNMAYLKSQIGSGHKLYDLKNILFQLKTRIKRIFLKLLIHLVKVAIIFIQPEELMSFLQKKEFLPIW